MKKFFPITDTVFFSLLALAGTALAVWGFLTPQEWSLEKLVTLIAFVFGLWTVAILVLTHVWHEVPTFVVEDMDVAVWVEGLGIRPEDIRRSITWFSLKYTNRWGKDSFALNSVFRGLSIRFQTQPISVLGAGWAVYNKAGVQKGKNIMVQWKGSIKSTEYFHELAHVIDEIYFKKYDYRHQNVELWQWVEKITAEY